MADAPKKSLGQHWLHDQASLEAMVKAALVQPGDVVLEIGPGTGALTEVLLAAGAEIVALEFDKALLPGLQKKFGGLPSDRLWITHGDIRTFNLTTLPDGYKVVANIPYYLTSNLIRILSEADPAPVIVAILVQKEVAQQVAARPGSMSVLSVTAQFYWEVSLGREVPANLFTPPPKIDSQILILKKRSRPLFDDVESKEFFRLVKVGFSQKRKTLLNSLSAGLHIPKERVKIMCESVYIDPERRAQTLSLEEWHNLYQSANA